MLTDYYIHGMLTYALVSNVTVLIYLTYGEQTCEILGTKTCLGGIVFCSQ